MKGLTVSLLLVLLMSVAARDALVIAAFRIHQDRIARELCVNIRKPEKKCHGKCALKDRLERSAGHSPAPASSAPLPEPDTRVVYPPVGWTGDDADLIHHTGSDVFPLVLTPVSRLADRRLTPPPEQEA